VTAPDNIYFILVRPEFLGNIGGTARVMKNFGFRKLRFVEAPRNYKEAEARKMAVAAFDVLKNAELFDTLDEALRDITFAIGTTSAQQRDLAPAALHDVIGKAWAAADGGNKVAVVFGDERNGLLRKELDRCHHIATIETDPDFPAMNLVQAVGIAAYEMSRQSGIARTAPISEPLASGEEDTALFDQLATTLDRTGFTRTFNRDKILVELRAFYQRANPTQRETNVLKGALIRLNERLQETD